MKNSVSKWLWQSYLPAEWQRIKNTVSKEEVDIAVVSVESLYAEPDYIDPEGFSSTTWEHFEFGDDGPIVTVTHRALDSAMSHAQTHSAVEVGGLCLGRVFISSQDDRLLIHVEEMIHAEHTTAGIASVTFTYETWQKFIEIQTHDFPNLRLLGWYHSHPGFGIFLSGMDIFIHQSFFTTLWHIAVVVDPLQQQIGFFARHQGKILPPHIFKWPGDLHFAHQLISENNACSTE